VKVRLDWPVALTDSLSHPPSVRAVRFSPHTAGHLAVASDDTTLSVLDTTTQKTMCAPPPQHAAGMTHTACVALTPRNRMCVCVRVRTVILSRGTRTTCEAWRGIPSSPTRSPPAAGTVWSTSTPSRLEPTKHKALS
jgi:hypothetical protein